MTQQVVHLWLNFALLETGDAACGFARAATVLLFHPDRVRNVGKRHIRNVCMCMCTSRGRGEKLAVAPKSQSLALEWDGSSKCINPAVPKVVVTGCCTGVRTARVLTNAGAGCIWRCVSAQEYVWPGKLNVDISSPFLNE